MPIKRVHLTITGVVQGVGFRPTVYRYATDLNLTGWVNNSAAGVILEVQGDKEQVDLLVDRIKNTPPPLSRIDQFTVTNQKIVADESEFKIIISESVGNKRVEISSDIATCSDCLSEIRNPSNRRFAHPFTNCTNCGPRFTIIKDRPYDRHLTSMGEFPMCDQCQSEYDNPLDRRFHAQPNACPKCGPVLKLIEQEKLPQESIISHTTELITQGKLVAIKGLGGFNICADALNFAAVDRLRLAKNRPTKSFALMFKDLAAIKAVCQMDQNEQQELTSPAAPIVLLRKRSDRFDHISPDNNYLGVILPYTPLHYLLLDNFEALVLTSANLADEPIAISNIEASLLVEKKVVDHVLTHNRQIVNRADDSIVQFVAGKKQIIRYSRGYTPSAKLVDYPQAPENKVVAGWGANLKNSFAFRIDNKIYLSQHIGDLMDSRNYQYQQEQFSQLKTLLDIGSLDSEQCDAHPNHENYHRDRRSIFHHHAHALSVMGEHGLLGKPVIAVICDGTGFGLDQTIWGFEFLAIKEDYSNFQRLCHLEYFPLPGGEQAIHQIDRIAVALAHSSKIDANTLDHGDILRVKNILQMIKAKINSPATSSLGRLFDGVAAILGIATSASYEAQGAILLQKAAEEYEGHQHEEYPISLREDNTILEFSPLIQAIIRDQKAGVDRAKIAYQFHLWVARAISRRLEQVPELMQKRSAAIFSGGCFQNRLLSELLMNEMDKGPIKYYFNQSIPINDAGIAFGQALL
ncbi:MAG: carbamoyltransferase HypF [Bdellovibrionales bacterium]|jgi:hydrogenase maturation protein HypF|nr:carbamoyltransferase HypF [Bdellovibrionales bacterium]MBT3526151.1 carbamoyltransferase HypF [Bdellovibrionales bacterium]MBT7767463.1 carbamoyltransferase HypF [Bdellovibrionales bacterium]